MGRSSTELEYRIGITIGYVITYLFLVGIIGAFLADRRQDSPLSTWRRRVVVLMMVFAPITAVGLFVWLISLVAFAIVSTMFLSVISLFRKNKNGHDASITI